ncbi:MAG TPA: zinc ABC transporter substrate-binding protein [Alphaproteobacteria bacterium]
MKKFLGYLCFAVAFLSAPHAEAAINIFACEPEWASLAQEIGGDKVNVKSATTAQQDVHHIQARPSLLAAMRQSDLVFCTGAELEIGWLPLLLTQAGNSKVQSGSDGWLMASDYVQRLEVPARLDRANGDVHPMGNPHIQMDPRNIAIVAKALAQRLNTIDPANAPYYSKRYADFSTRWQAAMARWNTEIASLRGTPIAVQHRCWSYLINWMGLTMVTTLEPKPGIPPTSRHLAQVLEKLKIQPVKAVLYAAYEGDNGVIWLSDKAGIPAIQLPFTVGGNAQSKDLFGLYDSTIAMLKARIKP